LGCTQLVVASENMDEVQRHFGGESDRGYLRLQDDVSLEPVVMTDIQKLSLVQNGGRLLSFNEFFAA
jgi:hypothetical protein